MEDSRSEFPSKRKFEQRSSITSRRLGQFLQRDSTQIGKFSRSQGDKCGLVRSATMGVRRQVGGVGLDKQAVDRDKARGFSEGVERFVGERDHPCE